MIRRFILAFNKLVFCYTISADLSSFISLVCNTKKRKWHSKKNSVNLPDKLIKYNFRINGQRRQVFLRTYAGDISIFYELFLYKAYKLPGTIHATATHIVDAGAHVGLASLFFLSLSPGAKLFSIEPDAENFSILQKNLKNVIELGKVIPVHAAIDNKDGFLGVTRSQFGYNTKMNDSQEGEKIVAISLNSLVTLHEINIIDIIKIDVEGYERKIFSENVEWLDLVKNIILETHSSEDYDVCTSVLLGKGFQIKKLISLNNDAQNIYLASKT